MPAWGSTSWWPEESRVFGDCFPILPWIGTRKMDGAFTHHRLPSTHSSRVGRCDLDGVPERFQFTAHTLRDAGLHLHIAAAEGRLGKSRLLHRILHIHPKVHDVGNELRMSLGLIPAAHDPE